MLRGLENWGTLYVTSHQNAMNSIFFSLNAKMLFYFSVKKLLQSEWQCLKWSQKYVFDSTFKISCALKNLSQWKLVMVTYLFAIWWNIKYNFCDGNNFQLIIPIA